MVKNKKYRWGRIIVPLTAVALAGCASVRQSEFSEPQLSLSFTQKIIIAWAKINKEKSVSMPFFKADGHFYTVRYVGSLAGANRLNRLTCFSQSPDALLRYNAVPVAFWGVADLPYRHLIMDTLHSLHGGDHLAVEARRANLETLVRASYLDNKPDWQTGFLIHALGDSYAHVHGDFSTSTAYGQIFGHGFARKDPDDIYLEENYKKYNSYVFALYRALSPANKDPEQQPGYKELLSFTAEITSTIQNNEEHATDLTPKLNGYTPNEVSINDCETVQAEIDPKEMREFLLSTSKKLRQPYDVDRRIP